MDSISIHEVMTYLSRLLERVAQGERFIIAKGGKPLVKVVPLAAAERAGAGRIETCFG